MLIDLIKLQLDLLGARGELMGSILGSAWLDRLAPRAPAPRAVLTLPGFLASGQTLSRLNRFLTMRGWQAESWGLGRNMGPRGEDWSRHLDALESKLSNRIEALADQTSAPVALLGQSLGGVYARDLASRLEPFVDRVITLGSPTFHPYRKQRHNRVISSLAEWTNRRSASELAGRTGLLHLAADRPALPVIAIHSPLDGIVDESSCYIPEYIVAQSRVQAKDQAKDRAKNKANCKFKNKAPRENIRVYSTHIGMNVNLWVWLAIADRLAQPRTHWQPFEPGQYFPGPLRSLVHLAYPALRPGKQPASIQGFIEASQR